GGQPLPGLIDPAPGLGVLVPEVDGQEPHTTDPEMMNVVMGLDRRYDVVMSPYLTSLHPDGSMNMNFGDPASSDWLRSQPLVRDLEKMGWRLEPVPPSNGATVVSSCHWI